MLTIVSFREQWVKASVRSLQQLDLKTKKANMVVQLDLFGINELTH